MSSTASRAALHAPPPPRRRLPRPGTAWRRTLPELADTPTTPLDDALRRLETAVSPFTGIVRGVEEVLAKPDDVRLPNIYCETGFVEELVGDETKHIGAGSAQTRELARAAAIAEALERYSACDSETARATVAAANSLGGRAVRPGRFALFSDAQLARAGFPYARFDGTTPVAWVAGCSLPDGEDVLLPAQLVYLAWRLRSGETPIARATSNGLACHATFAEAVRSGLLELIERDAFAIVWKARLSLPLLAWPGNERLAAFERRYLAPTGLRVAAVDLSAVWDVPSVLGVARSVVPGEAPLGVGAAAATTIERAVEKACEEAVRVRSWAQALRVADPTGATVPPPDEITQFEEHVHYYAYDAPQPGTLFLDESSERRDVREIAPLPGRRPLETVELLCERLGRRGASAYAADVTSPDVRAAGLRVARVIAPELCPLDADHATRYEGGSRLYEEPVRLGFSATPLHGEDLNRDPHPFP
jgi:ribosomal protein S12 methylthiotransferase accessory factor